MREVSDDLHVQGERVEAHKLGYCIEVIFLVDLVAHKQPGAELELNCMWAVSNFAAESGATRQCPGSHRWPSGRKPSADEIAIAEMPRGSVLLWLGSTLHGAGASTDAAATRHGMLLGYCNTFAPTPVDTVTAARRSNPRFRSHQLLPLVVAAGDEHAVGLPA